MCPATPFASSSPVAAMPRKKSGATTTGGPTWKTASPNSSMTWALTVSACKSSSPPKLLSRPSCCCSTCSASFSAPPVCPSTANRPPCAPSGSPGAQSWPGRATVGAPPLPKLGRIENPQPLARQNLKLGNSNFAEVGLGRSYLSRRQYCNPVLKCQETKHRKAQLRISGLVVPSPADQDDGFSRRVPHSFAQFANEWIYTLLSKL